MIHVIITSYKEPKSTLRAVKTFLDQKIKQDYEIIVVDPFPETEKFLKQNLHKNEQKKVKFFLDPGEGKGYALNILFQELASENKDDIFILTDGDVYVSENAVSEMMKAFKDKEIGCVTGRPITINPKDNKYHYWAHLAFQGIDRFRNNLSEQKQFFECSGYLFAIRKGVILDFPLETSEDAIIPYLFWKKGYKIVYVPKVEVYVKNPENWHDWKNQKIRNIKAHENLNKMAPDMLRTKSLLNEIKEGAFFAIRQPTNFREFFWTLQLYPARLYIYFKAFQELRQNKGYQDGWRTTEIESTKPLD
ncbi:MAG: glycosyltransferase family 2 protein [Nanoarchaeota archaeon]|nr:glycosyltransferase family 2 protein [Nanoarchaeota archaeon]